MAVVAGRQSYFVCFADSSREWNGARWLQSALALVGYHDSRGKRRLLGRILHDKLPFEKILVRRGSKKIIQQATCGDGFYSPMHCARSASPACANACLFEFLIICTACPMGELFKFFSHVGRNSTVAFCGLFVAVYSRICTNTLWQI